MVLIVVLRLKERTDELYSFTKINDKRNLLATIKLLFCSSTIFDEIMIRQ